MESVLPYVLAIVPTVGMGTLFYFVIKSILEGDRRERLAQARWEAEHDRRGVDSRTPSSPQVASPQVSSPQVAHSEPSTPPPAPKEH